ncbi:hypothetical protein RCL1_003215 [Eukaryota sp. TZLM3-RCL]
MTQLSESKFEKLLSLVKEGHEDDKANSVTDLIGKLIWNSFDVSFVQPVAEFAPTSLTWSYETTQDKLVIRFLSPDSQILHEVTFFKSIPQQVTVAYQEPSYQSLPFDEDFSTVIDTHLRAGYRLLEEYHSNVLPLVNSTGSGKSAAMRQQCLRRSSRKDQRAVYFTFPRFNGSRVMIPTFPNSSMSINNIFYAFLQYASPNDNVQIIQQMVKACQLIVTACFTLPRATTNAALDVLDQFPSFINSIVEQAILIREELEINVNIQRFTTQFVERIRNANPDVETFVLFADEVSSLIQDLGMNIFTHVESEGSRPWNLYRCWRHACRNFMCTQLKLLVIVAGTHTSLSHFCHDPITIGDYKSVEQHPYMYFKVNSGRTLAPLSTGLNQLFPESSTGLGQRAIAPLLSANNAASCRPQWMSYLTNSENLITFFEKIERKVKFAFQFEHHQSPIAPLLSLLLEGISLHETLLTRYVHCSFAVVQFAKRMAAKQTSDPANQEQDFIPYLVSTVDPLLAHFCWKELVTRGDNWQYLLIQILHELVSTNVTPSTLGFIGETIFTGVLLFLFQLRQSELMKDATIGDSLYTLMPMNLTDFTSKFCVAFDLNTGETSGNQIERSQYCLNIAESVLLQNQELLEDYEQFFTLLLGAFVIPLFKESALMTENGSTQLPLSTVYAAIKEGQAHEYLGVLKIQFKTSESVKEYEIVDKLRDQFSGWNQTLESKGDSDMDKQKDPWSAMLLVALRNNHKCPSRSIGDMEDNLFYCLDTKHYIHIVRALEDCKKSLQHIPLVLEIDKEKVSWL